MKHSRTLRLAAQIHRELAEILIEELTHPICKNITIVEVKVAPDLATAKIFISLIDESKSNPILKILTHEAKKIRWILAQKLNLRVTPRLTFIYDRTEIKGEKLHSLIDAAIARDQENSQDAN